MTRKRTQSPSLYGLIESSRLNATPVDVVETGTVRMALVLDLIATALEAFPEAREALVAAIELRLGKNPATRILP
jgi:hypothetical protein